MRLGTLNDIAQPSLSIFVIGCGAIIIVLLFISVRTEQADFAITQHITKSIDDLN